MDKNYQSKYSPDENLVTAAQYITEIICEKKAQSEGRGLPYKFWQHEEWGKYYREQIPAANKLLAKYDEKDIIAALRDKRTDKIYSLRNQYLKRIIEDKAKHRDKTPITHIETKESEPTKPAKPFGTKSLISKLRETNG